jgi:hypothetical protein
MPGKTFTPTPHWLTLLADAIPVKRVRPRFRHIASGVKGRLSTRRLRTSNGSSSNREAERRRVFPTVGRRYSALWESVSQS